MFLFFIATLMISHIVTGYGGRFHNHFRHSSSSKSEPPSSEEGDLIHPPWWHPKKPPGPDFGPDNEFGHGHHDFGPGHHHFGPGHHDFGHYRPNGGGGWGGDKPGGSWHPWGPRPTTTSRPTMTYPSTQDQGWSSTSLNPESITTELPGLSSTTLRRGINLVVESCIASCPVTPEHNPVCGTNDITYGNVGKLECARNCGVDVQLKNTGKCSIPLVIPIPPPDGVSGGVDNSRIQACMRNCQVTSEYNPVCGTDNVTYANPGRLGCAISCGAPVELSRNTACSVPPSPTPANVIADCLRSCPMTSEYSPVCGTNDVTYTNLGRLECATSCGVDVQLSRKTACTVPPSPENLTPNPITTSTQGDTRLDLETTETPNGNSNWGGDGNGNWGGNGNGNGNNNGNGTPSVTDLIACMQLCPMTPEINPVCGTDGVTYTNPGKLLCTQFCGVDVRVLKFASCQGDPIPSPIPSPYPIQCPTLPTVPLDPIQDCIVKCPTSPEFQPICGTDNVTYINLKSLQCRMNCGIDVSVQKHTPCEAPTEKPTPQIPPVWGNTDRPTQPTVPEVTEPTIPGNVIQKCINECITTQDNRPVCGTNGKTYSNLAKLICEQSCGINVNVKYSSACESNPMIEATTNAYGLDFTIPPEVLASIFPEVPVSSTSTTPSKDSDESYDLDQRFGEGNAIMNNTTIL